MSFDRASVAKNHYVFFMFWMDLVYSQAVSVWNIKSSFCFLVGLVKNESSHSSFDPASCRCGPFPESGVEERLR